MLGTNSVFRMQSTNYSILRDIRIKINQSQKTNNLTTENEPRVYNTVLECAPKSQNPSELPPSFSVIQTKI